MIKYRRLVIISLLIFCVAFPVNAQELNNKPNFVIIFVDDLGETDIGTYGNDFIATPNIDNLASEGMKWTNAYSAAPICSPSRAAILTGKNPARVHFTGHITAIGSHRHPENSMIVPPNDLMFIPKEEVILPEAIKPAGYTSISIGKWHVGPEGYWPKDMGFDENVAGWTHGSPPSHFYPYEDPDKTWNPSIPTMSGGEEGEYLADRLTDEAIEFITRNQNDPFLVYFPHYAVHTPLQAPEELVEKYKRKLLTNDGNKRINPIYAAMVDNLDQNVGRLLDGIERLGLEDNTVVIFASDNGAVQSTSDMRPYREGKAHLYEGGIRVPFIMKWPGHINPGTVSNRPTRTEDIYATVVDIVGNNAHANEPLDGRSLVSDFSETSINDTQKNTRDMYWYYPHYAPQGNTPGAAIISGDYKYLEFYDPNKNELYNLADDPGETIDLSDSMPEKIIELRGKLNKWLHDVNPILHTTNPKHISN